jgi:transketolase|tara:strand:- start:176 stop:1810 length:1635 start_codon:yes stop_codon:yes gene_type:complete
MKSIEEIIEGAREKLVDLGRRKHPYIATSLSSLEIQAVLQDEIIEQGNDHVYLPSHHASAYLCLLSEKGNDVNLRKLGTEALPYLFHVGDVPGVEYNSGAMGASMPVAVSKAKLNPEEKSYVLLGNAEMREGRTFEALSFAAAEDMDNLVVMVNDNGKSLDGESSLNYAGILNGFGFEVREVDGHDVNAIQDVIRDASASDRRYGIVFKTQRGYKTEFVDVPHCGISAVKKAHVTKVGDVISRVAEDEDFMVVAADTAKSTGLEEITKVDPSRLVNVGCSEQLLVGGLEAYQLEGKPVIAGTFAKFLLETGREQLEQLIANYREGHAKAPTVLIATHNGLSPGINGRSHHALTSYEFVGRDDVNLYHACDETQLEAMTREALSKPELTIILTERESDSFKFKDGQRVSRYENLHDESYRFNPGMPEEMTDFTSDNYTLIIANGLRVYDALETAQKEDNIEVLSLPSFPLDEEKLVPYLQKAKKVVVVEESIRPYLGEKVELVGRRNGANADYEFMHVTDPGFGGYETLVRRNGLNARGIQDRLK